MPDIHDKIISADDHMDLNVLPPADLGDPLEEERPVLRRGRIRDELVCVTCPADEATRPHKP